MLVYGGPEDRFGEECRNLVGKLDWGLIEQQMMILQYWLIRYSSGRWCQPKRGAEGHADYFERKNDDGSSEDGRSHLRNLRHGPQAMNVIRRAIETLLCIISVV